MARRNIFDILKENTNLESDLNRIMNLFKHTNTINQNGINWTIFDFVDEVLFDSWKRRGHCLDLNDFLETVDYATYECYANTNQDCLISFIEIVYNFLWLVNTAILNHQYGIKGYDTFYLLKEIMDDVLSQINYKAYAIPAEECVLIEEDKPEVTAVAEIIDKSLFFPILRYNHFTLKGDIGAKKSILIQLGRDLEAKRESLKIAENQLCSDIFFMLNNLNLRHNNVNPADASKYREHIANMSSNELESWYDELYQMILLAYLEIDNAERKVKVAQLKVDMGMK